MSLIIDLIGYRDEEIKLIDYINSILCLYDIPKYKRPLKPKDDFYGITSLPSLDWRNRFFRMLQNRYIKLKEGLRLVMDEEDHVDPEINFEIVNKHRLLGESHLICHTDCDGYYVPIDFKDIKLSSSHLRHLGSSINLRNELLEIALYLDFDLNKYFNNDFIVSNEKTPKLLNEEELFRYANTLLPEMFGHEKSLLLQLYNVVLASIKYDLLITLSG